MPQLPTYPPDTKAAVVFPELAKPNLKSELTKLKTNAMAISKAGSSQQPRSPQQLGKVLPTKLDGIAARGVPQAGPSRADNLPLSGASQTYQLGARTIYVNVLDTAQAPFMRDSVLSRINMQGTAAQGFIHGRIIKGQPAVMSYYPAANSSQLSVLVDNRYVVEVRVLGARSPHDAQKIFEALPLAALGK